MYQKERTDKILEILKKYHYTTVDFLVEQIRYSPATIRRDLTHLENLGLIKRSHGGAEINTENDTPFIFRQHSMKSEKSRMAEMAAKLVKNGDTVFLDGSSTVQYLGHYLLDKKDLCIVTNNIMLASFFAESGIDTYCAGGKITEFPGTTSGLLTSQVFSSFIADICFFSTDGIDENGVITIKPEGYKLHNRAMLDHSKKHVYLCSSDKIGKCAKLVQCTLDEIDYFISDGTLPQSLKDSFPKTEYVVV